MRGVKTPPKLKEKAIALYATNPDYSAVARHLGIARKTTEDLIKEGIDFAEFRQEVQQHYIVEAWESITTSHKALQARLEDKEYISSLSAVDLVMIVEKLHRTVTNVATQIIAIQQTLVPDSSEDLAIAAWDYVASETGHTIEEAKELLSKV